MVNLARCSAFILVLLFGIPIFTAQAETVTVIRVIDGDTCVLENGERVRYYGINAPESRDPQFNEATQANNNLVARKEKATRTSIVNVDLIEAVILLPEKLFYNTGAPGAIIVLNKNKPKTRKGKILFINASNEYEQHPNVRKLNCLRDEHIEKIVKAYKRHKNSDGFSKVVEIEEIKENDYNLNVTLYAFPEEEIEEIDVVGEWKGLGRLEDKLVEIERKVEGYLKELYRD